MKDPVYCDLSVVSECFKVMCTCLLKIRVILCGLSYKLSFMKTDQKFKAGRGSYLSKLSFELNFNLIKSKKEEKKLDWTEYNQF